MRPIDADTLLKSMRDYWGENPVDLRMVNDAPALDVKPVIHAHWVDVNDFVNIGNGIHTECSHCHTWSKDKTNYCRFCGAVMDEKENNHA